MHTCTLIQAYIHKPSDSHVRLNIYPYIYTFRHIHVYIHPSINAYTICMDALIYECRNICIHCSLSGYIHTYICTYIHRDSCLINTDTHSCLPTCTNKSIHTDIHAHLSTCIHTCIHAYIHVSQGCGLSDNKVFCSCSGHLSSNDRGNYQVKFPLSLFGNSDLQKMVIQFTP